MVPQQKTSMSDNTLHIKQQWELELNVIIEDDSWESTCSRWGLEADSIKNLTGRSNQVLQDTDNFCLQKQSQQQMLEELWYGR